MKKFKLIVAAIALAISFSAFTTANPTANGDFDFTYHNGSGYVPILDESTVLIPCPQDVLVNCFIEIDGKMRQVFYGPNHLPWKTRP